MRFTSLIKNIGKSRITIGFTVIVLIGVISYFAITKIIAQVQTFANRTSIGLVGQPKRINPLWSSTNEIDELLIKVFYRSLVKYDGSSQPSGDLLSEWQISEDGTKYTLILKPDQHWNDGTPITADDVIFTYRLTQHEAYTGAEKNRFVNVQMTAIDPTTVELVLPERFTPFIESLTLPILPKHIWDGLTLNEIRSSKYNLQPIGSTQYIATDISVSQLNTENDMPGKINRIVVENTEFSQSKNKFKQIEIIFYETEQDLTHAYMMGEIDRFYTADPTHKTTFVDWPNTQITQLPIHGQSVTLFFNLSNKNSPVNNLAFRSAFRSVLNQTATGWTILNSPIPGSHWTYAPAGEIPNLAPPEIAQALTIPHPITLAAQTSSLDQTTAQTIITIFAKLGVDIKLETHDSKTLLEQILPERKFDILIAGQKLGHDPDQYSFWHSSQTNLAQSGQNLSGYSSRQVDKALEEGRTNSDQTVRKNSYITLQEETFEDIPAIFIEYPPLYEIERTNIDSSPEAKPLWHLTDYLIDRLN